MMEGLGRGFVRTKEDLVRGTEAGLDMAREAARRGLQAADDAAHVMGINRIPVLRQYLWGQVHTGFWNSYEVSLRSKEMKRWDWCCCLVSVCVCCCLWWSLSFVPVVLWRLCSVELLFDPLALCPTSCAQAALRCGLAPSCPCCCASRALTASVLFFVPSLGDARWACRVWYPVRLQQRLPKKPQASRVMPLFVRWL